MFGICMMCHGELVRSRPHPRYLTLFYLMIAAGGALGGVAVTLIAPQVFTTYLEWELSLVLGCLLAIGLILRTLVAAGFREEGWSIGQRLALLVPPILVLMLPVTIILVDMAVFLKPSKEGILLEKRNFFGSFSVRERNTDNIERATNVLRHGAITHGAQYTDPSRRAQPITYYGTITGIGRTMNYLRKAPPPGGMRVGTVGLGTGTMAAFVGAGDYIAFYEINPAVIKLTEPGEYFTYLKDCRTRGAQYEIKLGDARLSMQRELEKGQPQRYHVIVLDAFSGDAIPAHLLTKEAFEIYLKHLSTPEEGDQHGALAVHISNRYLDLEPVVAGLAKHFGLLSVQLENPSVNEENISSSTWVILSHNEPLVTGLMPFAPTDERTPPTPILWTDDRSNLFDVLR
jgi:hypothetical protein